MTIQPFPIQHEAQIHYSLDYFVASRSIYLEAITDGLAQRIDIVEAG